MPETKLDAHHRTTVEHIFAHPTSHNIKWHDVVSLLEAVGTVSQSHDGKYKVTLGGRSITLEPPRHADLGTDTVVELRRLLREGGISPT